MRKFLPRTANNPQGFTLIELLVVISIIAILSVIGVTIFVGAQKNARDSKRRADIDAISNALEVHHNNSANENCNNAGAGTYCAPQDNWFAGGKEPTDPQTGAKYSYTPNPPVDGMTTYKVCASLEADNGATPYCKSNQQ